MESILDSQNIQPELKGKYSTRVSLDGTLLTIVISYVGQRWMPIALFGRSLVTLRVDSYRTNAVAPEGAFSIRNDNVSGLRVGKAIIMGANWPVEVREQLLDQINGALTASSKALSIQFGSMRSLFAALVFAYLAISMLMSGAAAPHLSAPEYPDRASAGDVAAPLPSVGQQLESSSNLVAQQGAAEKGPMKIKDALAAANKVVLATAPAGGKNIVIWSDILCPHCRDLESDVISKLPKDIGLTIIPVAFKDSRLLASYVLCGSDQADRAARWSGLMAPAPKGQLEKQCKDGPVQVDSNSILFARAGLTATPTIMSANGDRIFDGDLHNLSDVVGWASK